MSPPHFFVPSNEAATSATAALTEPLVCAIDAFDLEAPHLHPLEVVVGVTADGALGFATGSSVRERLAPGALKQLHFDEMAAPKHRRTIDARQLFLFDLQLVEQVSTAPDLNDPVYLYGTLVGPIDGDVPMATKGQLTVTRADLFHGLIGARPWAFRYPSATASLACCHHAWLAGGRDPEIAVGEGLVIAYPIITGVSGDDLENTAVVQLMLDEALSALRGDLFAIDQQRSAVARWLVKGAGDKLVVPPGAGIDAHFALAQQALALIPDVAPARVEALFRRLRPSVPGARRAAIASIASTYAASLTQPQPPQHSQQPQPPPPVRREVAAPRPSGPPQWMQDFMVARRSQGEARAPARSEPAPSHLTWTGGGAGSEARRSGWMEDFAAPAPVEKPAPQEKPAAPVDPDWMKDFK